MGVINSCHKFGSLTPRYYIATASASSKSHTVFRMRMTAEGHLLLSKAAAISQRRLHVVSQPQSLPAMLWQMSLDDLARCYNTEATKTTLG